MGKVKEWFEKNKLMVGVGIGLGMGCIATGVICKTTNSQKLTHEPRWIPDGNREVSYDGFFISGTPNIGEDTITISVKDSACKEIVGFGMNEEQVKDFKWLLNSATKDKSPSIIFCSPNESYKIGKF